MPFRMEIVQQPDSQVKFQHLIHTDPAKSDVYLVAGYTTFKVKCLMCGADYRARPYEHCQTVAKWMRAHLARCAPKEESQ